MTSEHPNVSLLKKLDPNDLSAATDLFADDVVFHYFNPHLPDLEGDYLGLDGLRSFFEIVRQKTRGTFRVQPVKITAVGDELVVTQVRDTLTFQGQPMALDVVVVWRFVDGHIVEVWDIVPGSTSEANGAEHRREQP